MTLLPVAHAVSPLTAGVKSLSYAPNCQAKRTAELVGCDDALLVDPDGQVLELPFASFGAVLDGELTMPPLDLGVLDSVTRRLLAEVVPTTVRSISLTALERATEACVIGTGMEVCPVGEVRGVITPDPEGPIVGAARTALRSAISMRLDSETRYRSAKAQEGASDGRA